LLKRNAIERLQVNQRVGRQGQQEREKALAKERAELVKGLKRPPRHIRRSTSLKLRHSKAIPTI
jgi:hypothetical protein